MHRWSLHNTSILTTQNELRGRKRRGANLCERNVVRSAWLLQIENNSLKSTVGILLFSLIPYVLRVAKCFFPSYIYIFFFRLFIFSYDLAVCMNRQVLLLSFLERVAFASCNIYEEAGARWTWWHLFFSVVVLKLLDQRCDGVLLRTICRISWISSENTHRLRVFTM